MKKIRNRILLKCYYLTQSYYLHEWARFIIINLLVPLLKIFFCINYRIRPVKIILRHSIHESQNFNLFMSDIDTRIIISRADDLHSVLTMYKKMKFLLPLLGETEVWTASEFENYLSLKSLESEQIWGKLFEIRKWHWQKLKLAQAVEDYERTKIQRGLKKSLRNLSISKKCIPFEKNFPQFQKDNHPFLSSEYDHYLYCDFFNESQESSEGIQFKDPYKFSNFVQILPGRKAMPEFKYLKLRKAIIFNEIQLSKSRLRNLQHENILLSEQEELKNWIYQLENS